MRPTPADRCAPWSAPVPSSGCCCAPCPDLSSRRGLLRWPFVRAGLVAEPTPSPAIGGQCCIRPKTNDAGTRLCRHSVLQWRRGRRGCFAAHRVVELIQQRNDAPSMYHDFLNAGHEGLHHVGYGTDRFEANLSRMLGAGCQVGQSGRVGQRWPFVYLLTDAHLGTIVELLDMSPGRERILARIAEAARTWTGKDPI
jgi:Glyoxalase/Bleomycin resistance protein/Dioxygenase superfamily